MRVSTETVAEHTAEFIRLIEEHGPATVVWLCDMTEPKRNAATLSRTRYRLAKCVEMGYLVEQWDKERARVPVYQINPDKTNRLAVAYTVKEQLANAIEDAIVDALVETPGMNTVQISIALGPMVRPWNMGRTGTITPESAEKFCLDLVGRGVLLCDGHRYFVKGAK